LLPVRHGRRRDVTPEDPPAVNDMKPPSHGSAGRVRLDADDRDTHLARREMEFAAFQAAKRGMRQGRLAPCPVMATGETPPAKKGEAQRKP